MSSTVLDADTTAAVLDSLQWPYVVAAGLAVVATLRLVRGWRAKLVCAVLIVLMLGLLPLKAMSDMRRERMRADAAHRILDRYCQSAGEIIRRRIWGVSGIRLQVISRQVDVPGGAGPGWEGVTLLPSVLGREHIETFLFWEHHGRDSIAGTRGFLSRRPSRWPGYRFVDVVEKDGVLSRYRLSAEQVDPMSRHSPDGPPSPFVVSYANMMDAVDSNLWIAGTKVWITDARAAEVVAERSSYSIERRDALVAPRLLHDERPTSCPQHMETAGEPMRYFVDRVLLVRPAPN